MKTKYNKKIRINELKKIKKHNIPILNTKNIVDKIYREITNNLQKELNDNLYNSITKELHNELIKFRDFTEKYINQRLSNEFELIKRELNLILNDQQPKNMNLDKEEIPSYYS